jgi:N-acetylglucosaminyl-diphospho-decaprenol L-rhamnosyltransferase
VSLTPVDPAPVDLATTGVVLVTHESRAEVLGALATLAGHPGPVVVVDAGSQDGTGEAVRVHHPDVRVLELANVGYGRGVNAGAAVLGDAVDVVVAANADVRFSPGALATLVAALDADPAIAIAAPRVRYPAGGHQASARRSPSIATAVAHGAVGWLVPGNPATRRYHALDLTGPHATEPCDVDWVSGCAFAIRRTDLDAVGGFDPGYRLYVEDVDLCDRLRRSGRRIRFVPAAVVEHRVGASTRHRPLRARLEHARGLDRYLSRPQRGPARHLRPLVWPGLVAWVVATSIAGAVRDRRTSTTGERR